MSRKIRSLKQSHSFRAGDPPVPIQIHTRKVSIERPHTLDLIRLRRQSHTKRNRKIKPQVSNPPRVQAPTDAKRRASRSIGSYNSEPPSSARLRQRNPIWRRSIYVLGLRLLRSRARGKRRAEKELADGEFLAEAFAIWNGDCGRRSVFLVPHCAVVKRDSRRTCLRLGPRLRKQNLSGGGRRAIRKVRCLNQRPLQVNQGGFWHFI